MIKDTIQKAINKQINEEFYSSYLYLSMSAYFESINLKGFAHWMREQSKEEEGHAMRLFNYLTKRNGHVLLSKIETPPSGWESPLDAFEKTYEHEQKITKMIEGIVNLTVSEKDRATEVFLQWFVTEQVEEEASADEIVQKLKLIKDAPGELFILNKELGLRTAVDSSSLSKGSE
jgi:ferritin